MGCSFFAHPLLHFILYFVKLSKLLIGSIHNLMIPFQLSIDLGIFASGFKFLISIQFPPRIRLAALVWPQAYFPSNY